MLGYIVTGVLCLVILLVMSKCTDIRINHRAKSFKRIRFTDGEFTYARWAMWVEFMVPFFFAVLAFIYLQVQAFSYLIFFTLAGCLWVMGMRILSWKTERIEIRNYTLYYYRLGQLRKEIVLDDVEDVTVGGLRLTVGMKNGAVHEIPMGFKYLTVLYAMLKYHRPITSEERGVHHKKSRQGQ